MQKILVSRCLLGHRVRYDGGASGPFDQLATWQAEGRVVAVCPEVAGGLPTPRPSAEIPGGQGMDVWEGRAQVLTADGQDFSEAFLDDAVVDYATDRMGGQLTIKAPNAKVPNVNADSPVNERINYYLQTEINPGLASHGGQVSLIDVVEDGIAVLKFGGGCQGCGQADVTLKEGIERTLLERIPELKGVRDVTDHTQKENAYY